MYINIKQDYRKKSVKAIHPLRVCNRKPPALVVPSFVIIISTFIRENVLPLTTADAVVTRTDSSPTTNAISSAIA